MVWERAGGIGGGGGWAIKEMEQRKCYSKVEQCILQILLFFEFLYTLKVLFWMATKCNLDTHKGEVL